MISYCTLQLLDKGTRCNLFSVGVEAVDLAVGVYKGNQKAEDLRSERDRDVAGLVVRSLEL